VEAESSNKSKNGKSKNKKRKKEETSDDEEVYVPKKGRYADRKPGAFVHCGECGK
jgi:DNA-directed RNA polymerase subunit M/transcription elongation factor TFIIS